MTDYEFIMSLAEAELGSESDFRRKTGHRLVSIAERLRETEWQPIETAPKISGCSILCWHGEVAEAVWTNQSSCYPREYKWCSSNYDSNGEYWEEIKGITHWMHMLKPPKTEDTNTR
jgi:hypothetical protein